MLLTCALFNSWDLIWLRSLAQQQPYLSLLRRLLPPPHFVATGCGQWQRKSDVSDLGLVPRAPEEGRVLQLFVPPHQSRLAVRHGEGRLCIVAVQRGPSRRWSRIPGPEEVSGEGGGGGGGQWHGNSGPYSEVDVDVRGRFGSVMTGHFVKEEEDKRSSELSGEKDSGV